MEITKDRLAQEIMALGQQEQQLRVQAENICGARRALEGVMKMLDAPEPEKTPDAEVVPQPDISIVPEPKRKSKK